MNILFVTLMPLETNSSVSFSNNVIIDELLSGGNSVTVVQPKCYADVIDENNKSDGNKLKVIYIDEQLVFSNLKNSSADGGVFNRFCARVIKYLFDALSPIDSSIRFINKARSLNLLAHYDTVISTSDPKSSHFFALKLINNGLSYTRWIQHWGDPLAIDITRKSIYPNFIIRLIEYYILKKADKIIYVSPITANVQSKTFLSKQHCIHHIPLPYLKDKFLSHRASDNELIFGYFGDYTSTIRNINPIIAAIADADSVKMIVSGSSDLSLAHHAKIEVYARLNATEILVKENQVDVIVCLCNSKGTQIPGKIFYYSNVSRIILVIIDGEYGLDISEYLKSFNRYYICNNNKEDIARAIQDIRSFGMKEFSDISSFDPAAVVGSIIK